MKPALNCPKRKNVKNGVERPGQKLVMRSSLSSAATESKPSQCPPAKECYNSIACRDFTLGRFPTPTNRSKHTAAITGDISAA